MAGGINEEPWQGIMVYRFAGNNVHAGVLRENGQTTRKTPVGNEAKVLHGRQQVRATIIYIAAENARRRNPEASSFVCRLERHKNGNNGKPRASTTFHVRYGRQVQAKVCSSARR